MTGFTLRSCSDPARRASASPKSRFFVRPVLTSIVPRHHELTDLLWRSRQNRVTSQVISRCAISSLLHMGDRTDLGAYRNPSVRRWESSGSRYDGRVPAGSVKFYWIFGSSVIIRNFCRKKYQKNLRFENLNLKKYFQKHFHIFSI